MLTVGRRASTLLVLIMSSCKKPSQSPPTLCLLGGTSVRDGEFGFLEDKGWGGGFVVNPNLGNKNGPKSLSRINQTSLSTVKEVRSYRWISRTTELYKNLEPYSVSIGFTPSGNSPCVTDRGLGSRIYKVKNRIFKTPKLPQNPKQFN